MKASRAFLVCVTIGRVRYADSAEELRLLVTSDGLEPCGLLEARREKPDPATFLGSGKVEHGEFDRAFDVALLRGSNTSRRGSCAAGPTWSASAGAWAKPGARAKSRSNSTAA